MILHYMIIPYYTSAYIIYHTYITICNLPCLRLRHHTKRFRPRKTKLHSTHILPLYYSTYILYIYLYNYILYNLQKSRIFFSEFQKLYSMISLYILDFQVNFMTRACIYQISTKISCRILMLHADFCVFLCSNFGYFVEILGIL